MAARFDAVIVPFGAVGAADTAAIALDSDQLAKVPGLGSRVADGAAAVPAARRGMWARGADDYAAENFAFPLVVPSPTGPDRFYFKFGSPVDTAGIDHKDAEALDQVGGWVGGWMGDSFFSIFHSSVPPFLRSSLHSFIHSNFFSSFSLPSQTYADVKAEVQKSIDYLLEGRERDPFRALPPRLLYEAVNDGKQAPTFTLNGHASSSTSTSSSSSSSSTADDDHVDANAPSIDPLTQAFVQGTSREV